MNAIKYTAEINVTFLLAALSQTSTRNVPWENVYEAVEKATGTRPSYEASRQHLAALRKKAGQTESVVISPSDTPKKDASKRKTPGDVEPPKSMEDLETTPKAKRLRMDPDLTPKGKRTRVDFKSTPKTKRARSESDLTPKAKRFRVDNVTEEDQEEADISIADDAWMLAFDDIY